MSQKSVKFHVKSDDYFATLATILSLVTKTPEYMKRHLKIMNKLKKRFNVFA